MAEYKPRDRRPEDYEYQSLVAAEVVRPTASPPSSGNRASPARPSGDALRSVAKTRSVAKKEYASRYSFLSWPFLIFGGAMIIFAGGLGSGFYLSQSDLFAVPTPQKIRFQAQLKAQAEKYDNQLRAANSENKELARRNDKLDAYAKNAQRALATLCAADPKAGGCELAATRPTPE